MDLGHWIEIATAAAGGWLAQDVRAWIRGRIQAARTRDQWGSYIAGLPPECLDLLGDFVTAGSHTMRANPSEPAMRLLIQRGLVIPGPSGGTYSAVDRYLTLRPDVWDVLPTVLAEVLPQG